MMREIVRPVLLCDERGRLDDRARGFSRTPLHRANLRGAPLRKKRWDYWCVATDECFFALTIADVDYARVAAATCIDVKRSAIVERAAAAPVARGIAMPDTVRGASIDVRSPRLRARVVEHGDETRLVVEHRDLSAEIAVSRPRDHESVNVVVPWSASRFQFTSKHVALPARGRVVARGRTFDIDAFACLDYGRGAWPYRTRWNWAAGAGVCDGRVVGMNLGGAWTDGTGATENGVVVDGRLHKIHEDTAFAYDRRDVSRPWRIESPRVELSFEPFFVRRVRAPLVALSADLRWTLGRFHGNVTLDDGTRLAVRQVLGWAEELTARW
jgi:hypothetical protein